MKPAPDATVFLQRRARYAALASAVSIGLILFLLGLGLAALGQAYLIQYQSMSEMRVFIRDSYSSARQQELDAWIRQLPQASEAELISKEAARRLMLEQTGEDVAAALDGVNPLPASYVLRLRPGYLRSDSLLRLKALLETQPLVAEVQYAGGIEEVRGRMLRWTAGALLVGMLLAGIGWRLVYATIRLSIYARRSTIRTLELLGATPAYIRRPFLRSGLLQGSSGGLGAAAGLAAAGVLARQAGLEPADVPPAAYIGLLGGIAVFGVLLGWLGSRMAVSRFLHRPPEELL
ncbi:MAG: permease-like cell division protein FtsX [Bacteroidia bacterium]|nr:permease-like cell division protein FtsX [Bacteroidia bacterium]